MAKNAIKHGLLSERPPLLATEDLETFEGIVQSLIKQYQPVTVEEWHLVNTAAMGMQRQHRLWETETAIVNEAILPVIPEPYTSSKYPQRRQRHSETILSDTYGKKTEFHPENLVLERELLDRILNDEFLMIIPNKVRSKYYGSSWSEWKRYALCLLKEIRDEYPCKLCNIFAKKPSLSMEDLTSKCKSFLIDEEKKESVFYYIYSVIKEIETASTPSSQYELEDITELLHVLQEKCELQIKKITEIEHECLQAQLNHEEQLATRKTLTQSTVPPDTDALMRYERHIVRQTQQAFDRLNEILEQRKT